AAREAAAAAESTEAAAEAPSPSTAPTALSAAATRQREREEPPEDTPAAHHDQEHDECDQQTRRYRQPIGSARGWRRWSGQYEAEFARELQRDQVSLARTSGPALLEGDVRGYCI